MITHSWMGIEYRNLSEHPVLGVGHWGVNESDPLYRSRVVVSIMRENLILTPEEAFGLGRDIISRALQASGWDWVDATNYLRQLGLIYPDTEGIFNNV